MLITELHISHLPFIIVLFLEFVESGDGATDLPIIPTLSWEQYVKRHVLKSQVNFATLLNGKPKPPMATYVVDYPDLFVEGEIFVDKTMFIKYVHTATPGSMAIITSPRNMGKTINLKMLEFFYQPPTNEKNDVLIPLEDSTKYKLFTDAQYVDKKGEIHALHEPLLISEDMYMMENELGRRPVFYLNFSGIMESSHEATMEKINSVIGEMFMKHDYIRKFMEEKPSNDIVDRDIQEFQKYKSGKGEEFNGNISVKFLCYIFNRYADFSKPIILIDGYDVPLIHAYLTESWTGTQRNQLLDWFDEFFLWSSQYNEDHYVTIVTGSNLVLKKKALGRIRLTYRHYSFLDSNEIFFFYGFHQSEVDEIMRKNNVPQEEYGKIREFYGGYRNGHNFSLEIYNPRSIAAFLNHKIMCSYWTDRGPVADVIKARLYSSDFQRELSNLISGRCVIIFSDLGVLIEDLRNLANKLDERSIRDEYIYNILKLMFADGYLTFVTLGTQSYDAIDIETKLPNKEIKEHLASLLEGGNKASTKEKRC